MTNFSKWSYEALREYMVVCYYAGAHEEAGEALEEMKKRKEYYEDED